MPKFNFKNFNCPKCGKHVVLRKFMFITPDRIFDCMHCSTKITIEYQISERGLIYSSLILIVPTFFYAILTKNYIAFIILVFELIAFGSYGFINQRVVLASESNISIKKRTTLDL